MKHHLFTAAILLIAVAFYLVGYSGMGTLAFVIGGAFETWFWIRFLIER